MAALIVIDGPAEGKKFALGPHRLVAIGRDHSATFQILDTRISRLHMQIKQIGDGHAALDFESSNGVQINGNKIAAETPLSDGDVMRIGNTSIVYSVQDDPDAQSVYQLLRKHGEGRYTTQLDPGDA